jgi:crotonobetainyl-CoA:carnitine CoA-transferase CaiB-like acyl-CoA transferase
MDEGTSGTSGTNGDGALSGLRVIDLTMMLAGPFCTMLLADQGADVVKIEPIGGDGTRSMGPFKGGSTGPFGGYFQSINRGKRSIAVNLKRERGKEIVRRLVADADVLVENYRVGVMDRLGLGYEALAVINPRLIYAAIRGFGDPRTGASPYQDWPAYDVIAQAMGGMMGITGPKGGPPTKTGPGVGDTLPGALTAFGILAAVYRAERTGEGQFIDVAMYDAVLAFCERIVYQHAYTGEVPGPDGNGHPLLCPFGVFPARDGWVSIACPGDHFWTFLARATGREDMVADERYRTNGARVAHADSVVEAISAWTSRLTKREIGAVLGGQVPFGPVNDVSDIYADAHVAARGMLVDVEQPGTGVTVTIAGTPVKMTRTPGGVRGRSPLLGEHTDAILSAVAYSSDEIARLRDEGVVG